MHSLSGMILLRLDAPFYTLKVFLDGYHNFVRFHAYGSRAAQKVQIVGPKPQHILDRVIIICYYIPLKPYIKEIKCTV